jgi:hypothetical protein
MLPGLTLPASWQGLLETFRPAFRRRSTFALFVLLASGLVAQTGRRSVVGMLAGARMQAVVSFHRVCRFFSAASWDPDRLGLLCARLITERLLPPGAPVLVVVDDTLFKRWGRKVHGTFVTHDGSAQGRGSSPGATGGSSPGSWSRCRGARIRCACRCCLGCGPARAPPRRWSWPPSWSACSRGSCPIGGSTGRDAAYHGKPLVIDNSTWTCRLPANAALYAPAPPRTGKRGRPRTKGDKLGTPAELAATGGWQQARVRRYGRDDTVQVIDTECLWYGSFGKTPGRVVLLNDDSSTRAYDLAIYTLDLAASPAEITARYADRWPIEPANAIAKGPMGVGQARNRVERAVKRTVPFGMLVQSLVIVWYTLHGYHPDDITARRAACPWYDDKTEPAFEDMLAKLRRTIIAARFTPVHAAQPDPELIHDYALACAAAAA